MTAHIYMDVNVTAYKLPCDVHAFVTYRRTPTHMHAPNLFAAPFCISNVFEKWIISV